MWVSWLVIYADGAPSEDETLLIRHLTHLIADQHQVVDEQLAATVDLDSSEVWSRLAEEEGELSDLVDAAETIARVDREINDQEREILAQLQLRSLRK